MCFSTLAVLLFLAVAAEAAPGGNGDTSCSHCHSRQVKEFEKSIHSNNISCTDCHGGDANISGQAVSLNAMGSNFTGIPARTGIAGLCAKCHREAAGEYRESIHSKELEKGVSIAATCTDCHGAHGVLPHKDPNSLSNQDNVPLLCAKCHENQTKMSAWYYGIKTDRFDTYKRSYHYKALLSGGKGLATCQDCHENHDTGNVSDPASSINPANLPATCGKQGCHPDSSALISGKVHEGQSVYLLFFDAKKSVTYFYIAMILFELAFTLGLIFLGITSKFKLRRD